MGSQDRTSAANNDCVQRTLCNECKSNSWRYKCPGCSVRTCSLPCVKAHKQRTYCTGKRQQTQSVPLSQFDDNLLLSDYNLLEEVKRVAESAQRARYKLCRFSHFNLPFHLRGLRNAARQRKTTLLFLPSGMSKRERNQTRYDHRKRFVSWTIEWRFHSTDCVLLDHGVHENTTLSSVVVKHLRPGPWRHQLKHFCEEQLDCLKFFIRVHPKGPNSPFREMDIKSPIRQELSNLVILENPVIYVFLPSHPYDFKVVRKVNSSLLKSPRKDRVSHNEQSPRGITFKEEEIVEDGSSSGPHVSESFSESKTERASEHAANDKSVRKNQIDFRTAEDGTGNKTISISAMKESGVYDDMDLDFDFDQGLIDAYSDLISQMNPDDFLDLGGQFTMDAESKDYLDFPRDCPVEEELEEGEIPDE